MFQIIFLNGNISCQQCELASISVPGEIRGVCKNNHKERWIAHQKYLDKTGTQ